MNLLDASVVTDAVASSGVPGDRARRLVAREEWLHAPAVLGAEVTSALRSMLRRGALDADVAQAAAHSAAALRSRLYPFPPFLPPIWDLRDDVTTYDAWYVALAEELGAALVTADQRLQRAAGPRCPVLSPEQALEES